MASDAEAPPSKNELLRRANEAYAEFSAALASIAEARLEVPGAIGTWSARDVMAHVGADEQWMAGQLEALLAGVEPTAEACYGADVTAPSDYFLGGQDERNAWQHEMLANLALDEARTLAAEGHRRLLAVIEQLTDEQLSWNLTIVDLGSTGHIRRPKEGEQPAWPLWMWLRGVTYKHYAEHAEDLRAAGR